MAGENGAHHPPDRLATSELKLDLREALSESELPSVLQADPPPAASVAAPEPEPAPELAPDPGKAPVELDPGDIYRIVDGREASDSRWSRLSGRARELLTSPSAKREEELDHDLQQLRVRGLARGVTVALGSIKGGVGKTTLTLTLADMLAEALRCGVIVVDADLEWGTAADSTPENGRRGGTITDVLAAAETINSPGELAPYLLSLPGGAQLLAGPTEPHEIERLTAQDMQALLDLLKRFFPVILLDLSPGIGLRGTIPRWAFASADEIVAIATATRGSLRRAGRMLTYLREHRPEVPITLALNMVPRRPDESVQKILTVARRNGQSRGFAAIPRDDALMRQLDAGLLNVGELDQTTRVAVKGFAYQLASGWCR
ncbi:MAG TPA: AAA family ATPase [Solirubrobacteraceae bacterium]|nr:AAA family ATPase [Solirubrobacteraceae bacterium]